VNNPLARRFQDDCLAWYRHHTGHNYRGRQHVTIVIAQKYGGLRMARHIALIMPILDQLENAVRAEHQLPPLSAHRATR